MEQTDGIDDLAKTWSKMDADKGDMITRCEQYAAWTTPHVCPIEEDAESEQTKGNVAIGSRLVNHLSNKVGETMFPSDKPFFTIQLSFEARQRLAEEKNEGDLEQYMVELRKATAVAEEMAMRKLNLTSYRPVAVQAIQHQIVTGNVIIFRTGGDDEKRVVYGVKDFCVSRDLRGNLKVVLLRDNKKFKSLSKDIQTELQTTSKTEYKDNTDVVLYTHFEERDGRWHRVQGIDNTVLEDTRKSYAYKDFPVLALTWNLSRGEDYGRGLVEEYSVIFHNIDALTKALLDLIGFAADLKHLVDPSSQIDIEEINNSDRGSYHPGRKDDISTPDFPKRLELALLKEQLEKWERDLAQAFLLTSAGVRDAERVTAEEIRFYAKELESAFGGLYSHLALEWQQKEAEYLISSINFEKTSKSGIQTFDIIVVVGLDSLSREGQLDSLRLAIGDLQMLEAVPEEIRGVMNSRKLAEFIFLNRGVPLGEFLYTEQEMQERQAAMQQQEMDLMQQQTNQAVAAEAGKAAMRGNNG